MRTTKNMRALNALKYYNNFDLLRAFGETRDRCVEYSAAWGRGGVDRTLVWSLKKRREFLGRKTHSFPLALASAKTISEDEFARSPFGGMLPLRVLAKVEAVIKTGVLNMSRQNEDV